MWLTKINVFLEICVTYNLSFYVPTLPPPLQFPPIPPFFAANFWTGPNIICTTALSIKKHRRSRLA